MTIGMAMAGAAVGAATAAVTNQVLNAKRRNPVARKKRSYPPRDKNGRFRKVKKRRKK